MPLATILSSICWEGSSIFIKGKSMQVFSAVLDDLLKKHACV